MYSLYRTLWKHGIEMSVIPCPETTNAVNVRLSKDGYERNYYIWAQPYDEGFSRYKTREFIKHVEEFAAHVKKLSYT